MGADNLIYLHKWEKWEKIFNNMSIVIFRRHGYNNNALKSIASQKFKNNKVKTPRINLFEFNKVPSWLFIDNKEIKISSTEIRNQRKKFRGEN